MPVKPSDKVGKTARGKADLGQPGADVLAPKAKKNSIRLVPSVCDVSVTNACNAKCDFCSYAYDKQLVKEKRWIDRSEFARALPILHRRGIRYVNFQGGEPLLHPKIEGLVADTRIAGMKPALITNGWFLPQKIENLVDAGLGTLLVSIDSHSLAEHERNRGLHGSCQPFRRQSPAQIPGNGQRPVAAEQVVPFASSSIVCNSGWIEGE